MATYLVQIINEPHQLIALKVRPTSPILLPIKSVAELIVEVEGRSIEVIELLYDWRIEWRYEYSSLEWRLTRTSERAVSTSR